MLEPKMNLDQAIFAKTAIGQHEIKTRELGLTPLVRRLLILVDGKHSGKELAPMLMGQSLAELLAQLLDKQCIEFVSRASPVDQPDKSRPLAEATPKPDTASPDAALAQLPAAETRSAKEIDMARNFMTNTVNMEFGQHARISVIEAISICKTALELRQVYPLWYSTMGSSRSAAKELSALNEKLFRVL
jgi:hypothetical protein